MQQYRNIIFDFGGVFIDVDYKRTEQAFVDAGIKNFSELYSQQSASPLFENLETGKIKDSDFYMELRKISGIKLDNYQITSCWNSILGNYFPQAIEWLKDIRERYKVFLFSNTNAIHYDCFMNIYEKQFRKNDFNDLFDKTYYSHLAGIRKPNPEAFEYVLKDAGISAIDTLFIDDTISNIKGAKKAGLNTIFLNPPAKVWELDL
jgi:epoxide hydrolase-like predicted phosphatase